VSRASALPDLQLIQPVLTKPFHHDGYVYERWWNVRRESRFLIGGIVVTPSGYRGLLLGTRVGRELRYVGTVEWGVSRALVDALTANVPTRTASVFTDHRRHRDVVWLEPRVVAEVTFAELVNGWLRDPVFRQLVLK
jgi:ATP-dependent DNA ligase